MVHPLQEKESDTVILENCTISIIHRTCVFVKSFLKISQIIVDPIKRNRKDTKSAGNSEIPPAQKADGISKEGC